jgi:hypothetical protein
VHTYSKDTSIDAVSKPPNNTKTKNILTFNSIVIVQALSLQPIAFGIRQCYRPNDAFPEDDSFGILILVWRW